MSTLGFEDNVLCTTAMSSRSLREFCEAAGIAGFSAISLAGSDYKEARSSGLSDPDIRMLLADNGLQVAELDGIVDWLKPLPGAQESGFDVTLPFFGHTEEDFYTIADAVDARSVTAADPFPSSESLDEKVEAFARLCDRAAEHGLLVHLEFLSWGPVPDLATGWDVVRTADRPNGGLTIDTLHLIRSGSRDSLPSIPAEKIFSTQFCDGPEERVGNRFSDAANRQLLGEGDFGLASILRELENMGCSAPLGFEVMNPALSAKSAVEVARIAYESVARLRAESSAISGRPNFSEDPVTTREAK